MNVCKFIIDPAVVAVSLVKNETDLHDLFAVRDSIGYKRVCKNSFFQFRIFVFAGNCRQEQLAAAVGQHHSVVVEIGFPENAIGSDRISVIIRKADIGLKQKLVYESVHQIDPVQHLLPVAGSGRQIEEEDIVYHFAYILVQIISKSLENFKPWKNASFLFQISVLGKRDTKNAGHFNLRQFFAFTHLIAVT
jgi:hypothetical protein